MSLMVGALSFKAASKATAPEAPSLDLTAPASIDTAGIEEAKLAISAGAPPASIVDDPFTRYHTDILALHEAMKGQEDEVADRMMDQWHEIDTLALASRPTTLPGALGALLYAQRERTQFQVQGKQLDAFSRALVHHLVDGAMAVIQEVISQKAA